MLATFRGLYLASDTSITELLLNGVTVNAVTEKMGRKQLSTRQRMANELERTKKARKDDERM